jgi:Tfp pilus assembly protein PilF/2-polyprenyl-3-methyl-5-hydroxy-6-metoxy-1,4-benzoquinol methylase
MNRKERRAAQKQVGRGAGPPRPPGPPRGDAVFATALSHLQSGDLAQAERTCRDLLALVPDHCDGLHLLGIIAHKAGRNDDAVALIRRALAIVPHNPDAHFNLAQVLRGLGRLDDAVTHFNRAIELRRDYTAAHVNLGQLLAQQGKPDIAIACYQRAIALDSRAVDAHFGLGNLHMEHGRFAQAETHFRQVLALAPNHALACNNFGVVLAALDRPAEAAVQYRRASALQPGLVGPYRNLGRLVLAQGDAPAALELARQALQAEATIEAKALFVQCVKSLTYFSPEPDLIALVTRALIEGWERPSELAAAAAALIKSTAAGRAAIVEAAGAAPDPDLANRDLAAMARDPLLLALMESAPIPDIATEQFLTAMRSALLAAAMRSGASDPAGDEMLLFAAAMAQQCFINEYVFANTETESTQAKILADDLGRALQSGAAIPALWPAVVGSYLPLHELESAPTLMARSWPPPITRIVELQVTQPLIEHELRATIPRLTGIDDAVSRKVQQQYEEMPYPRWLKAAPAGPPTSPLWYLRNRFPAAPIRELTAHDRLDVLVAGCGTGLHSIETARRFAGANVLAVDLSRASLCYAKRQSDLLGLRNIEYAQADILHLATIGRRFDVIESVGVLHHLADPEQGWRVLVGLLRPGGLMQIGLYSETARQAVRAVRAYIADRGFPATPAGIRKCRLDLMELAHGSPLRDVFGFSDFFTTSACRDLLFHVQEQQFTLPRIQAFLSDQGLTLIGLACPAEPEYRRRFPDDPAMRDLDNWQAYERDNPATFANMYQFWVQKP